MKKAKVLLASIAILGVVGGAMAFNAKKNSPVYTIDPSDPQLRCLIQVQATTDPALAEGPAFTTTSYTFEPGVCSAPLPLYPKQ